MKKFFIICFVICILALSACQAAPEKEAVVSKNNGLFESALTGARETDSGEEENAKEEKTPSVITDTFTSSDNTISYTLDMTEPLPGGALPVLEVTPHTITSGEAEQIAAAIFGDADMYVYTKKLSKSEIEAAILSLRQAISDRDALIEKYEGNETVIDQVVANFENRISEYEQAYEDAPELVEAELCDWEFRPLSDFGELSSNNTEQGYDELQCVKASTTVNGFPYIYNVYNRDSDDGRVHAVFTYIDDLSVEPIEIYSTQKPSDQDMEKYAGKAEDILRNMGMGEWEICSSDTENWEDYTSGETLYRVNIYASRIYNGVPTTYCDQLNVETGNAYASDYSYEQAHFVFSGNALVSFECTGFLDLVDEINHDAKILSFEEIIDILKTQLQLTDANYAFGAYGAEVNVDQAEIGLSRIRIKNNASNFYLVPTYTFYSNTTLLDQKGEPIIWYGADDEVIESTITEQIMTINAVDGSVINTQLGY